MHNGIDIAMPKGAPVGATVGGKVVYAGFGEKGSGYGGYGNVVVVKDAQGRLHQYSHLDSIGVKVGQTVPSGALVGKAGSTGRSTGPHLDYVVKNSKGQHIDPTGFITGKQAKVPMGLQRAKDIDIPKSSYSNTWKTQKEALKAPGYQAYKGHLKTALQSGKIPATWVVPLTELIGRESTWNAKADNSKSTAWGYGQFLESTRKDYEKKTGLSYNNPVNQIIMTAQYVKDRYGTPEKALQHWDKNKWY
ncbi:aggregation-promoting factor C-terminal-like domain-containing protein [Cytobacillus oceanisediminis]|uniref:aggregation-promoting factor C-terminal-like domain-containing protein n=1 Tax=Cytobacillus oceanisediminis TaxID=665099 RepID=UPI003736BD83